MSLGRERVFQAGEVRDLPIELKREETITDIYWLLAILSTTA